MAQNFDMISFLPDTLLFIIIISLIPFKEAVRTSILSKRWLHLWKNTTNIEFNEHFFVGSEFQRWDFLHFITLCIENYQENSIVEKLSLTLADPGHVTSSVIVERCVDFSIQQGVKDLDLDFSSPYWTEEDIEEPEALFELRTKVYENKTLKSLKLFSCNFPENELMKFHALKEVSLGWMELKKNAIETLLSNCKMIEILNIKKCWTWNRIDCVGVDELRLKKLIVDSCFFMEGGFLIDAPNLTYFKFYGNIMYFDIDYSSHLEEVDLYFGLEYENPKEDVFIYSTIRNFKYVKVLTICGFILKEMERISTLFELRHLKMNTRHLKMMTNLQSDECVGVRFFLNSCPMLELLTFDLGSGRLIHVPGEYYYKEDDDDHKRTWLDNGNSCQCLTSTLKVVEMNNFTGFVNEILMLHFLICNGTVLRRVNINVQIEETEVVEKCHKLEELMMTKPRASNDLEILFTY